MRHKKRDWTQSFSTLSGRSGCNEILRVRCFNGAFL